jgi:hypothetical protein
VTIKVDQRDADRLPDFVQSETIVLAVLPFLYDEAASRRQEATSDLLQSMNISFVAQLRAK